ncbi:MerR family transcriptional regulator [Actinobacteria bacterium YIM 96077]|uniref:MerR family transcriptional regulator n=1 Tax=Phytoactinopolyspora halophila TaxID=1981511 RepID=A0A329R4B8_9ACTN|nr:MerR family transcriptional regulator [Phytoactinopolyspora halophila]AYY11639.1 MerR family transcriptional regulator [Actinobacteria bacterium YIM 96077]RAW17928.1 MerR family transcriptional regulator [Phytoactinopolyspora halophila]
MHIGELSRRTEVNAHQLRYYEAQGLLEPERTTAGYRVYDEADVVTVKQIRHLLDAGLSTDDIAYLLPCATGETPELIGCPELLAAMRTRLRRLDEQVDTLNRSRQALAHYIHEAGRIGSETYGPFGATAPKGPTPPVT